MVPFVDEVVEGVFEGAGENLFVEADRDEFTLGIVVVFVLHHTPPVGEGYSCFHAVFR